MRILHTHRSRRSTRGFTLVELMAVIAIVGVMGAIAMATVSYSSSSANAGALARSLQFAMMGARGNTISDGFQRRLNCTLVSVGGFCLVEKACQPGMTLPNICVWTQEQRINAGNHATIWNVTLTNDFNQNLAGATQVTATPKYVVFKPDGSACDTWTTPCASNGLTVYVSDIKGSALSNHFKVYVYATTGMARLVNQW